jgi:hypothetical protein
MSITGQQKPRIYVELALHIQDSSPGQIGIMVAQVALALPLDVKSKGN